MVYQKMETDVGYWIFLKGIIDEIMLMKSFQQCFAFKKFAL